MHDLSSRQKMDVKIVFLIFALIVQVNSECSGYFECLSESVADNFFGGNSTDDSDVFENNTEVVGVKGADNKTLSYFGVSNVGTSLTGALTDVSTLIQDQVKGLFKILDQTDVHKEIENKTEIHVRAFSLGNIGDNATETEISLPNLTINNFTQFNDELNALKVEIEKQLQDEIDSFIIRVLENDTADWIDVTEKGLTDADLSTTEKPYPDFMINFETQIMNSDNNKVKNLESHSYDNYSAGFKVSLNNQITEDNSTNYQPTEDGNSNVKILENSFDEVNSSGFKVSLNNRLAEVDLTSDQPTTKSTELTTDNAKEFENTQTAIVPSAFISVKIEDQLKTNHETSTEAVVDIRSSTLSSISSTTTINPIAFNTAAETSDKDDVKTSTTVRTTTEAGTDKDNLTTAPKPIPTNNSDEGKLAKKQDTQTKAPKNVKTNEISKDDPTYYDIEDDRDENATDYPIIDYIDLYKDTTNEDIDFVPTLPPDGVTGDPENVVQNENEFASAENGYYTNDTSSPASIFPWIAAIFRKDSDSYQFDYYCDGILLSNTAVLTAGRCLQRGNETVDADDVIIFLGKRSLQSTGEGESILKVKQLTLHPNFTVQDNTTQNDLAILLLEEPAVFNEGIQPACLLDGGDTEEAVTTAWGQRLTGVRFVEKNQTCKKEAVENTFCATYGSTVAFCPSFGGVYAAKQADHWCVGAIRTADPSNRGPCFDKTVAYTDLTSYRTWIDTMIK